MPNNKFFSEIFEDLNEDYQMLINMGEDEPFMDPKMPFSGA